MRVFFCLALICFVLFFQDRVSLYSLGCPGTHSVDQAGLELRNPPASASRVLGLKVCATTPGWQSVFLFGWFFWDRVSLCSPGCPGTHSADQAGLELSSPPPSKLNFKLKVQVPGGGWGPVGCWSTGVGHSEASGVRRGEWGVLG